MFSGCSNLQEIKLYYASNFSGTGVPNSAFTNWVNGVASTGDFYYNGPDTTVGVSAIPKNWTVHKFTGLTFIASAANSTVGMTTHGTAPSVSLEYSTNGFAWNDFIVGTTTVTLANVGDKMYLRAKTTNSTMATDESNYNKFVMTGQIEASGNIMSLLNKEYEALNTITEQYAFASLFKDCDVLTSAPDLQASTLANGCYNYLFNGCSSLNSIKMDYTGNFSTTYFNNWVNGVASTGTFQYDGEDSTVGDSAIPSGWTVVQIPYVTFTARQANSTISMSS